MIDMLYGFSMSVDYKRILSQENQIVNTVITHMIQNNRIYVPHDFIPGRYVFFVIVDGKRTLHGTAMAIYQQTKSSDVHQPLEIDISDDG